MNLRKNSFVIFLVLASLLFFGCVQSPTQTTTTYAPTTTLEQTTSTTYSPPTTTTIAETTTTLATTASTTLVNDSAPPVISSINSEFHSMTLQRMVFNITWVTDEPATSQVQHGTTAAYSSNTTLDQKLVTYHAQQLNVPITCGFYHYRVRSRDASGNEAVSDDFILSTYDAARCGSP